MKEQSWGRILTALFIAFATTASAVPIGVTVNSVHLNDDASINDPNWTYNSQTGVLTFHGSGNFMVSGTNTAGKARIVIPNGVTNTVRVWNLNLQVPGDDKCIFALGTNACVSLILKGTNTLASGKDRAGIEVPKGASLSITSAAADEADMLTATGGQYGAGIGGGNGIDGGTVIINSSVVTATGGGNGAGIGGGNGGKGGTVTINDGVVTATGGSAGIGGGNGGKGGTVTISGGRVTATGGSNSAGIGGGNGGDGGTLTINGGRVAATGGDGSAGVGGGNGGKGGTVTISGGSLFAQGKNGGADIGQGSNGTVSGANTFTGGAVHLANNSISVAPTDGSQRVWCMTVTNLTPHALIVVTGLDPYGMNDLVADNAGKLRLWLPNGNYTFTAGGAHYAATIDSADTTATLSALTPPDSDAYITFSSANTFEVKPKQGKSWNGILYYSTDTTFWSVFTTDGATSATDGAGEHKLYLCGSGNSYITGNPDGPPWSITATAPVTCSGNLETLLDHAKVNAGEHPAMAPYCFSYLFKGCASLVSAPSLPATNLTNHCYYNLFNSCTGLTNAPALPATTLPERCYNGMFNGCTNLTQAPALPATTLGKSSYGYMFYKCTGLTSAPALPATTLANECYKNMFMDCTALTSAPALPATTLASACYDHMFSKCTGLTNAPTLPATTLAPSCYINMFSDCIGLMRVPELPAMNLAESCYNQMFRGCTNLTRPPELPATTLAVKCYYYMFYKCTGIELNTAGPGMPWSIPANATAAPDWNRRMFYYTGGTLTGGPAIGTTYYLASGLPDAPAFPTDGTGFVIGDGTATLAIINAEAGLWYTVYATDDLNATWQPVPGQSIRATGSHVAFTFDIDTATVPRRFFKVAASLTTP